MRPAVECTTTAKEGFEVIGQHIETFGQVGNCQMMGNYSFDSGLLVANTSEASVVSCVGSHWAARQVEDVMVISSRYQISDDCDASSLTPESGDKINFRASFSDEKIGAP